MGRLLDSCDGRVWKGQLSAWSCHVGSEFRMDSGVNIPTTMLLPAKSTWYYVGSWMYCKLVELSVVSWGCVVVSLNYNVKLG